MSNSTTNAGLPAFKGERSIAAALEACGSSPERIRECVLACRRSARRALDSQLHRTLALRGYDAGELCASELTATLTDVTVCDLLQTISMGRKDAVIEVVHGALTSRIWCSGGEIVDAESGRLKGELAFYRIWGLEAGDLCADFRPVRRARVIDNSTQGLMLEAARRKDECAVLRKQLGSPDMVYAAVPQAATSDAETSGVESALLEAFNPSARIDAVVASGSLGDLEMLQALCSLVRRGCLVPAQEAHSHLPLAPADPFENGPRAAWLLARARALCPSAGWCVLLALALGVSVVAVFALRDHTEPQRSERAVATTQTEAGSPDTATTVTQPQAPLTTPGGAMTSVGPSPPVRGASAGAQERPSPAYPVQVKAEPAQAALWLDGERIATGALSIALMRDGRTHELRIDAPEHHPQTLLFRDLSPPRLITLERVRGDERENGEQERPPTRSQRQPAPRSETQRRGRAHFSTSNASGAAVAMARDIERPTEGPHPASRNSP